jgi:hypothetical protein
MFKACFLNIELTKFGKKTLKCWKLCNFLNQGVYVLIYFKIVKNSFVQLGYSCNGATFD